MADWHAHSGETADTNLTALCTRDHHTKDLPGWSYRMDKHTGTFTITTPTNDRYTSGPEPLHPPRTDPLTHTPPDNNSFTDHAPDAYPFLDAPPDDYPFTDAPPDDE